MKNNSADAIIGRIQAARLRYAGVRGKSRFAREIGLSPSTYSYYEKDRIPPIDVLIKISKVSGCDLDWLLTGEAGAENFAFVEKEVGLGGVGGGKEGVFGLGGAVSEAGFVDKKPHTGRGKRDFSWKSLEKQVLSWQKEGILQTNVALLRKIDGLISQFPDLAAPVSAFVDLLASKKDVQNQLAGGAAARPEGKGWIPVLGRTAAGMVFLWDQTCLPEAGRAVTELEQLVKKHTGSPIVGSAEGRVAVDMQARQLIEAVRDAEVSVVGVAGGEGQEVVEFVQCEEISRLFPDCFALRIDGDSMSPRINDGDFVIASPSVPAGEGQAAIAKVANQIGVTCKLIRRTGEAVHLVPINERYETKVVGRQELLWALAVLCHIRV